MKSMRRVGSPHICVFCHKEETRGEYMIGVTEKNGKQYNVYFPESIEHYLKPNLDHPWGKLYYYPPQWFIDAIMEPGTKFFIPATREHVHVRQIGYLSSLSGMAKQWPLCDKPQACLDAKRFKEDDVVDTHGTDGNLGDDSLVENQDEWLVKFNAKPLPSEFYEHLKSIMNAANELYEYQIGMESFYQIQINATTPEVATVSRSFYHLYYQQVSQSWALDFKEWGKTDSQLEIGTIPGLNNYFVKIENPLDLTFMEQVRLEYILREYINSLDKNLTPKVLSFATDEKKDSHNRSEKKTEALGGSSAFFSQLTDSAETSSNTSDDKDPSLGSRRQSKN